MSTPVERVVSERRRRGWSIRTAAQQGGISNQTWSVFERTGVLTDGIRRAAQRAFDWPGTWPDERAEVIQPDEATALRRLIAEQALQLEALTSRVEDLDAELRLLRLAVARGAADSG